MRLSTVLRIVGPVMISIGIAMLASSLVSVWYREAPEPLALGGIAALLFGTSVMALFRKASLDHVRMQEGCAIVALSWIFCCAFGAIPFVLMRAFGSPVHMDWSHAFYEITSGFTTTGSSVLTDVEILPKGILFWRSLTHWFGGMGIVVLAVAILPKLGVGGMQAFRWESPGPLKADKLVPRIQDSAKILYTVYLAITLVEILLLLLAGIKPFDAAVYTFGTVGTGGFGVHNTSVAGLHSPAAEWIIASFMWLSGANFGLTYLVLRSGSFRLLKEDREFLLYTSICFCTTAIVTISILSAYGNSLLTAVRYAFFQVATIITTTGYATTDYSLWPGLAIAALLPLMFIGGCTGSTGGGPKVLRYLITGTFIGHELRKLVRPNLITTVKVSGRPLGMDIVGSVIGLLALYIGIFFLCGLILTASGHDIVTAFTASIANLGNIGPGLGAVGPAGNYSGFVGWELWMLSGVMLLGRLELYTLLVLFLPSAWRRG